MNDVRFRWEDLLPRALGVAVLVVIVAGLKLGKELLVTITLAAVVSVVLSPLVGLLRKIRVPRVPAVLLVVAFALGVLGAVGVLLVGQIASIGRTIPEYRKNIQAKIEALHAPLSRQAKKVDEAVKEVEKESRSGAPPPASRAGEEPLRVQVVEGVPSVAGLLSGAIMPSLGALGSAAAITLLVLFFLIYSGEIHDRVILLVGSAHGTVTSQAISESMLGVVRYLSLQAVVNLTYGVVLGTGLWALGVPSALLWGFAGAMLRFVPYLGPVIGCLLPVMLALAVFPGWWHALGVAAFVGSLELLNAYVVEPIAYGHRTGLSPLAIVLSALCWAWLWGGIGLLLSVPLTVCLLTLGKHLPRLGFLEILLGSDLDVDPNARIYLRLLARNPVEASRLIDEESKGRALVELGDGVLLPLLRRTSIDRQERKIDEGRATEMVEEIRELAKDAADTAAEARKASAEPGTPAAASGPDDAVTILCLPASDDTDEIAASLLSDLLIQDHHRARSLPSSTLTGEKLEAIEREHAEIVVISALPPSNILRARYLYKRLRSRFPALPVLVGIWGTPDPGVLTERIAPDRKATLVGTFAAALGALRERAEAVRLARPEASRGASLP